LQPIAICPIDIWYTENINRPTKAVGSLAVSGVVKPMI
jgi:hypothetical protein